MNPVVPPKTPNAKSTAARTGTTRGVSPVYPGVASRRLSQLAILLTLKGRPR